MVAVKTAKGNKASGRDKTPTLIIKGLVEVNGKVINNI